MKKSAPLLFAFLLLTFTTPAGEVKPAPTTAPGPSTASPSSELSLREVRYDGRLSDDEARFTVCIDAEATGKGESSIALFEGRVALLPVRLPDALRIIRE